MGVGEERGRGKRRVKVLLIGIALIAALSPPVLAASAQEYIVGFHELPSDIRPGSQYESGEVLWVQENLDFAVVETYDPDTFEDEASIDSRVRYVELNRHQVSLDFTPQDPKHREQYGDQLVRAPLGWDNTRGDHQAAVCVVDSGVRATHADITSNYIAGQSWVAGEPAGGDVLGHGTEVAGVAAAVLDNAVGVTGVANAEIFDAHVYDAQGNADFADIADAIDWCANRAPNRLVINLSFCLGSDSQAIHDAVSRAWSNGRLLVSSAGNDPAGDDCPEGVQPPASWSEVVAVSCIDRNKDFCDPDFRTGSEIELTAPGSRIATTCADSDSCYTTSTGTSYSSPFVAGSAALMWSDITSLDNSDVRNSMNNTAEDLSDSNKFGHGKVDVKCLTDPLDDACNPQSLDSCEDGGPDLYGYTCKPERFDWATMVNPITHDLGEEDRTEVDLGYPFDFYGVTHTSVFVHSDGRISFENLGDQQGVVDGYFEDLDPSAGGQVRTTAASLGDLNIDPGIFDDESVEEDDGGGADIASSGNESSDGSGNGDSGQQSTSDVTSDTLAFVAEWKNVPHYTYPRRLVSVQIVLVDEDYDILVTLDTVNDENDLRDQEGLHTDNAYVRIREFDFCNTGLDADTGWVTHLEEAVEFQYPSNPDVC